MNVAIVDYGAGNLHSLAKALQAEGARVEITADVDAALRADSLVLPGVGSFGAAAARLTPGMDRMQRALRDGMPCLGICLGMQLMFERSAEGEGAGLALMRGTVRKLNAPRLPHMGWNDVDAICPDPLFTGLDQLVAYYANSYVVEPDDDGNVIAWSSYGGDRFPAAVRMANLWGVQFHPEKSGSPGRLLLRNFVDAAGAA